MDKISAFFITGLFPSPIQISSSSPSILDPKNLICGEGASLQKIGFSRRNFSNSHINPSPTKSVFKDSYVAKPEIDKSLTDALTPNSINKEVIFSSKNYSEKLTEALNSSLKAAGNLYQSGRTTSAIDIPYTIQKLRKIYSTILELENELRKFEDPYEPSLENRRLIQENQNKIIFYIDMLKERIIPGFQDVPEFL